MKVPIGFASILGTVGALAGVLIMFIGDLRDAASPLGVSPELWAKITAVLVVCVVLGRMGQAAAALLRGGASPVIDGTATDLHRRQRGRPPAAGIDVGRREGRGGAVRAREDQTPRSPGAGPELDPAP